MSTSLSNFGRKLSGPAGITELMKDLGEALSVSRDVRMLGGGNPAHIPDVQAVWRRRMRELMDDGAEQSAQQHVAVAQIGLVIAGDDIGEH